MQRSWTKKISFSSASLPGLLVADTLLEPDNVDIALFLLARHRFLHRLQCILRSAKYLHDVNPLRDRCQVRIAFPLLDGLDGRVHTEDLVSLGGQVFGYPVRRLSRVFDIPKTAMLRYFSRMLRIISRVAMRDLLPLYISLYHIRTVARRPFERNDSNPGSVGGLSEQNLQDMVDALQGVQQGRGLLPCHRDPVFFGEQAGQAVDGLLDVQVIVHAGPEQGLEPSRRL